MQSVSDDRGTTRPTIAIVMRGFRRPDYDIWLSATEAAREHDLNVVTFTGHAVDSPVESQRAANAVYELVNQKRVDGALVLASGIGLHVGTEGMLAFCERFGQVPLVSAQMPLPGIPSLLIDNYRGMRDVVDHLIEVHGYRRIGFIRGPVSHAGAQDRYRAYCESLVDHGIPLDPDLVAPPTRGWDHQPGIPRFLDRFRVASRFALDAVVGASAGLAQQAQSYLRACGIRIAEDVALAGFDDFPFLWGVMPPMTTARAPFGELGRCAIELLLSQMRGEDVPLQLTLPARIVVRQSCGCPSQLVVRAKMPRAEDVGATDTRPEGAVSRDSFEGKTGDATASLTLSDQRATMIAALADLVGLQVPGKSKTPPGWVPELVDSFIHDFESLSSGAGSSASSAFLPTLKNVLMEAAQSGRDVTHLQDLVSELQGPAVERLMARLEAEPREAAIALATCVDLLTQGRVMVNEVTRNVALAGRVQTGRQIVALSQVGHTLTTAEDLKELTDTLSDELPEIGIQGCYLALYEDPSNPAGMAYLRLARNSRGRIALPPAGLRFSAPNLLPIESLPGLLPEEPYNVIVEPLFVRSDQYGFLLLEVGPQDILFEDQPVEGTVYDLLRGYVSDALCGISLYDEAVRARQQAEEADRLKSRFLSMVSHELRTPLNVIASLSEMLLWEQRSDQQELARIHASAQHLDGLIRDVLDLASSQVGQLRLVREPLDLRDALEVVTVIGEQMANDKGMTWMAEIPDRLPKVWGDRTRLRQVALNLVSNAFRFTAQGEVRLQVVAGESEITVSVSDTGIGVPVEEQEAIFDEFRQSERTTARGYGGLGLGLAISRRLVEMHGGTIGVRSSGEEGEGATFYFRLPILREQPEAPERMPDHEATWSAHVDEEGAPLEAASGRVRPVAMLTERKGAGESLRLHLRERGYPVIEIIIEDDGDPDDPHHWLNQVLRTSPAALILDMKPALERGWALMRVLKENPGTQSTPVLFYSLLREENSGDEVGEAAGTHEELAGISGSVLALDYLTKPVSATDLAQALDRHGITTSPNGDEDRVAAAYRPSQVLQAAPPTLLVVDDEPDILAMHAWLLQSQLPGSQILQASNGRRALELMAQSHPDLVLLDLMMPELNGFEVISAMQHDPDLCDIPVIVLTAKTLTDDAIAHLNQGVMAVLGKGLFSAEETFDHIEAALQRARHPNVESRRLVRRAMAYIHEHYPEPITRKEIAAHVSVSARHLDRCFCEELSVTPIVYLNRFRLRQARRLLESGTLSIGEVAAAVGYSDSSYFCRVFRRETGMSPSDYIRAHRP